jgi:hypothetical protein
LLCLRRAPGPDDELLHDDDEKIDDAALSKEAVRGLYTPNFGAVSLNMQDSPRSQVRAAGNPVASTQLC